MDTTLSLSNPDLWLVAAAAAVMGAGGFVKGAVGFALPMVALSGLGLFLTAQESIALLLVPSAISNFWQSLRQGWRAARDTFLRFWRLNLAMAVMLALSAQLVPWFDSNVLFVVLGATVTLAAAVQLSGWQPRAQSATRGARWTEVTVGIGAGAIGGVTSVWGPAVLLYLIARSARKSRHRYACLA